MEICSSGSCMWLKTVASKPRTPDGYRLATFTEIRKILNKLNAEGLLTESQNTRVLDGIVCGHADLPITDKRLAEDFRGQMLLIQQNCEGVSRNNPELLRKDLYSRITIDDDDRRITALHLARKVEDIEAIYWLRQSLHHFQLIKERENFQLLEKNKSPQLCSPDFYVVYRMLLFDNPGEKEMVDTLNYALQSKDKSMDYAIAVAEIVLAACSKHADVPEIVSNACPKRCEKDIVSELIKEIAKTKVDSEADEKHTAILAKLLSESVSPRFFFTEIDKDKDWLPKLLSEACRRQYKKLTLDLHQIREEHLECSKKIINIDWKRLNGKSPLHTAAEHGEIKIVEMLLRHLNPKDTDNQGRTALHLAARAGHVDMVKYLLQHGSDPLQERDMKGRTALHYAVTRKNDPHTPKQLVDTLLGHYGADFRQRNLLISVSASGIGTAEETEGIHSEIKTYLKKFRKSLTKNNNNTTKPNLLMDAAKAGNPRLVWEFLLRCGITVDIDVIPQYTRKHIEKYMEQGVERPTYIDTLGRKALAECVAEHFLNSHIKSPITVCISGGSGMGKTSLVKQIKAYLQITCSQLAFPYLWKYEDPSGHRVLPSEKGKRMIHKIEDGIIKLMETQNGPTKKEIAYRARKEGKKFVEFLERYRPEHEAVYKSLACMDFAQLLKNKEYDSGYLCQGQLMGAAPRVLTVDFNAGYYRENHEAWAGLALKITQAIEDSMTWAQMLSTRWKNARRIHNTNFFLKFILPAFLMTFLAVLVAWGVWLLLDRTDNKTLKDIKYGSIPATIIALVWGIVGKAASVFKSVSTEMEKYFKVGDYKQSYQERVISDIKFLKKEIGKAPLPVFSVIAGERCNNWFGLWKDNIEDTSIPKYGSAPGDKLQIIAFVDDLDHCEDEAVLKVLWSIDLVFRECDINFILAVDKTTIQNAFINSPRGRGGDSMDEFISKIIQLPVNLPDPPDDEWNKFLQEELGLTFDPEKTSEACKEDASSSAKDKGIGTSADWHLNHADRRDELKYEGLIPYSYTHITLPNGKSRDLEAGSKQSDKGISSFFQKVFWLIQWILCFLFVGFNDRNETEKVYVDRKDYKNSKELKKRMLAVRGSLTLTYGKDEIQTFDKLKTFAVGRQKFPREWKCCIKYHRFARNVIMRKASKKKIVFPVAWHAEFVAWIFVCAHWKPEMNTLIKHWDKLVELPKENSPQDEKSSPKITSLKEVVFKYKTERWPEADEKDCKKLTETLNKIQGVPKNWAGGFKEYEIKCGGKEKETEFNYKTTQSIIDAEEEERGRWDDLYKCLDKIQDVPLRCLHIFQEFRFHCDAKYLKIPYDKIVAKERVGVQEFQRDRGLC